MYRRLLTALAVLGATVAFVALCSAGLVFGLLAGAEELAMASLATLPNPLRPVRRPAEDDE